MDLTLPPSARDGQPAAPRLRPNATRLGSACMLVAALWSAAASAGSAAFPRPAELEPDVRFWTRVFTEVDTNSGFIHDNERLGVVYGVVRLDPDATDAEQRAEAGAAVERYRAALLALAQGKEDGLTAEEVAARAAWGPAAGPETLRGAAERVRFQRGQSNKYRDGYVRSGRWRPFILETLRQHGVPAEVAALPHVESSFNPAARSHADAAGLWQFTRPTGKLFLRIDAAADERLDPYRSTVAAARLLRRNHELTGTWPLALTAYNHGPGGVRRAVSALGTDDIAAIVRQYRGPAFGFASRNFYVSFLAALDVEQRAHVYFGPLERAAPQGLQSVSVPHRLGADVLARSLRLDLDALRAANPAVQPAVWQGRVPVPGGLELWVPDGAGVEDPQAVLARTPPAPVARAPATRHHRVRKGETLAGIAARYGVDSRELMSVNGLRNPHRVRAGQRLRLPSGTEG
jgi:membrane-bound lytic murein transglycosylase D